MHSSTELDNLRHQTAAQIAQLTCAVNHLIAAIDDDSTTLENLRGSTQLQNLRTQRNQIYAWLAPADSEGKLQK